MNHIQIIAEFWTLTSNHNNAAFTRITSIVNRKFARGFCNRLNKTTDEEVLHNTFSTFTGAVQYVTCNNLNYLWVFFTQIRSVFRTKQVSARCSIDYCFAKTTNASRLTKVLSLLLDSPVVESDDERSDSIVREFFNNCNTNIVLLWIVIILSAVQR